MRRVTVVVLSGALLFGAALSAEQAGTHSGGSGGDCLGMQDWYTGSGGEYTYAHAMQGVATPDGYSEYAQHDRRQTSGDLVPYWGLTDDFPSLHARCDA